MSSIAIIRLGAGGLVLAALVMAVVGIVSAQGKAPLQRYGSIIGLKPEKLAYYKELHAAVWPGVLKMIKDSHIRNYSIYLKEIEPGKIYLFSYLEYTGTDFAADMAKMAADPTTRKWWKETDPCQFPIPVRTPGEKWVSMEEVFHLD